MLGALSHRDDYIIRRALYVEAWGSPWTKEERLRLLEDSRRSSLLNVPLPGSTLFDPSVRKPGGRASARKSSQEAGSSASGARASKKRGKKGR